MPVYCTVSAATHHHHHHPRISSRCKSWNKTSGPLLLNTHFAYPLRGCPLQNELPWVVDQMPRWCQGSWNSPYHCGKLHLNSFITSSCVCVWYLLKKCLIEVISVVMMCKMSGTSSKLRSAQASRVPASCRISAKPSEVRSYVRWSQENCQPEIGESRWQSANR